MWTIIRNRRIKLLIFIAAFRTEIPLKIFGEDVIKMNRKNKD